MVLLAWNILHGGGPGRIPEIALALVHQRPDVVVLTEFRTVRGGQIRGVLTDHGLEHQSVSHGPGRANGVLIACREPAVATPENDAQTETGRFLDVWLPASGVFVTGVHVPDDSEPGAKAAHWQRLVRIGRARREERAVMIGDFNTGRRGQDAVAGCFGCEALQGTLCSLGYVDAWRSLHPGVRDATWVAPWGEGRRLDAAFLSPPMASDLLDAEHLHEARERRVSDHSALVVRVRSEPTAPQGTGIRVQKQLFSDSEAAPRKNFA